MRYRGVFLFIFLIFTVKAIAQSQPKLYFPTLAQKIGLQTPRLKEGNFEIRVWKKCQLCYGDAQVLYQLTKGKKKLSLAKYDLRFDKHEFVGVKKTEAQAPSLNEFWPRLLQQDVLTLPDQAAIAEKLHPKYQKDSTWNIIGPDGTVSVHAKKIKRSIWISDGESYHFEVFSPTVFERIPTVTHMATSGINLILLS